VSEGIVKFRLHSDKENWLNIKMCWDSTQTKYLGTGTLTRSKRLQCDGLFYLYKKESGGRKANGPEENQTQKNIITRHNQQTYFFFLSQG
jgi:hypothetical protein